MRRKPPGSISSRVARRIVIGVIGATVMLVGVVMLVTPGPGIAALIIGLAILGTEFVWARYWLSRLKRSVSPRTRSAARRTYHRYVGRFFVTTVRKKSAPPLDLPPPD